LAYLLCPLSSPQDDPFLSSCLRAVRRHSLMMLRQKARILVPPSHAATLVGSPDDSGLLGEDEVFLQVGLQVVMMTMCM
jgi:hypothetical protein